MIILDTWRTSAFGPVRILFGMVWAIDAYFKWKPSFVNGFSAYLMGAPLALVIWSTAEGLGGPYTAGSTDIGTAIIYVFVFALLYLSRVGLDVELDRYLGPRLGGFAFLASGPPLPPPG